VASASDDQTIRLTDIVDPAGPVALTQLTGHTKTISAVTFVPDAGVVVSASYDATFRVWDIDPDRLAVAACAEPSNRITAQEWADNFDGLPYAAPCG
jgi:hypothetical protein